MIFPNRRSVTAFLMLCAALAGTAHAQTSVLTYHNGNAREGRNSAEKLLTPANVNPTQFGKLFTVAVDGYVYAEPLVLAGVHIGGGTHNVVYVATSHDSVYALDGNSGAVYWRQNLIPAGGRTVVEPTDIAPGCDLIPPEVGIVGTPVIDPATHTLYVVATSVTNGTFAQYLHALDAVTGAEKFGGPVEIQASVPGTGIDAVAGKVTFNARQEVQRAGLLLSGGLVSIAWTSHCDIEPWHGWVMGYDATTLKQTAVLNTSPNGSAAGIWMGGGALAADAGGTILFATGNGTWDGITEFGDSLVKVGPPNAGTYPVLDYFTPFNQSILSIQDLDLGSGAPILLPALPSGEELLTHMGKTGTTFVVDENDMGKYCRNLLPPCTSSDPQIVEELVSVIRGVWGTPAYWNGNLYFSPSGGHMSAFSFNTLTGAVSTYPTSQTPEIFVYGAPIPSVSANGTEAGIVWGLQGAGKTETCSAGGLNCAILYAYDATNLSGLLYSSNFAGNNRDVLGGSVRFATPTIANGKVYVGSQYAVSAFGELAGQPFGVSLKSVANVFGLAKRGAAVTDGGLDHHGDAYPSQLLGSSLAWSNATFLLGSPGPNSAATSTIIPLPAGEDSTLSLLATGVDGAQAGQTFIVTYTDGTTTSFTQSLSDWHTPQNFSGESVAYAMDYRITHTGNIEPGAIYVYGYTFALDATKKVSRLTLPKNSNVVVLAVDLTPATTPADP